MEHLTLKKVATFYLIGGAAVAIWGYSKGYTFDLKALILWPMRIKPIASAPKMPPGSARTALP